MTAKRLVLTLMIGAAASAIAQTPVVMLSDIHLDPFHDPGKFAALRAAAPEQWGAILAGPATATQAADFEALQAACSTRGIDTPPALLAATLAEARRTEAHPAFVAVLGDLMAHKFDCRYETLAAKTAVPASAADYSAFAAKTVAFVALSLRQAWPGVPVYLALGNNDSGCRDYWEDPRSAYLAASGTAFAGAAGVAGVAGEFSELGDYAVALPKPMTKTRLVVLQDIFESTNYKDCKGAVSAGAAAAQIAWLRGQLAAARTKHERVWVMAHIPPGVDAYSTFTKAKDVCAGQEPVLFLASDALAATLAEFADVVTLALFGHTHMDELRLYAGARGAVPGKLVPSVSPVNGNMPSFVVAAGDPAAGTLKDFSVYTASTAAGAGWTKTYDFDATYGVKDLSAASLQTLMKVFLDDKDAAMPGSNAYASHYFAGDPHLPAGMRSAALKLAWHPYVCSITQTTVGGFRECMCKGSQ